MVFKEIKAADSIVIEPIELAEKHPHINSWTIPKRQYHRSRTILKTIAFFKIVNVLEVLFTVSFYQP
jgi:hypothetical protein